MPGGKQLYRQAYDLRNRFAHGARDLAAMTKDADELVCPMRSAARDAIASALNMHWTGDRSTLIGFSVYLTIKTTLGAPKGAPLGRGGELPRIRVEGRRILEALRRGRQVKTLSDFEIKECYGPGVVRGPTATVALFGEQVGLSHVELRKALDVS